MGVMMGNQLIREARLRAGLTQRELAERAGTTQSAVARWEGGGTAPDFETVRRLVDLCGLTLEVALVERDDSDFAQAQERLRLTPAQRLARGVTTARLMREVQGSARAR